VFIKYNKNPIITPNCKLSYEKECTYNPCAVTHQNKIFLIYRAEGIYGGYISRLCLAISKDGFHFTKYKNNPIIKPDRPEEKRGCEDPRITKIGDTFYLTYTAFEGYKNHQNKINLSLAISKDLIHWQKKGIILKDIKSGYIYPKKVKGMYLMFVGDKQIKIAKSKNLINWQLEEKPLLSPRKNSFDSKLVEVGPPIIETKNRLIMIYNSADKLNKYSVSYIILDKQNPTRLIYRSDETLIIPSEQFELFGKVNNVVFAEGLVKFKGNYFLYYGGGDKCVGVATFNGKDLSNYFRQFDKKS